MIIKSHIRGGYRAAADYLKNVGKNEAIRLVQITDPDAHNLDEAFKNMWSIASNSKATKPLHHISINPFKDERLTDEQVQKIIARCEEKFGYKSGEHQRVVVEHILDGRQHFHVIWNRVSLETGKAVWPGMHWKKSKQVAREMEKELGLKSPVPRRLKNASLDSICGRRQPPRNIGSYPAVPRDSQVSILKPVRPIYKKPATCEKPATASPMPPTPGGSLSAMCENQRIDFIAACEGRISWGQYFEKWGAAELTL